jgi:hypothetical protein
MRSPSKNMCSVRQRPMPSAPKSRAARASAGVSALVRTFMRRMLVGPAHDGAKSPDSSGCSIGTSPFSTWPESPSMVMTSPFRKLLALGDQLAVAHVDAQRAGAARRRACPCRAPPPPRGWSCRRAWSGCPRRRACRGCPRAGLGAHEDDLAAFLLGGTASSDVKTISPVAAPGEAGRPWPMTSRGHWGRWSDAGAGRARRDRCDRRPRPPRSGPRRPCRRRSSAPRAPCACRSGPAASTACRARW